VGEEMFLEGSVGSNLREGDHSADPSVDGMIILRWIFRKLDVGMEWIYLAQ
jgi:hypothetical protein